MPLPFNPNPISNPTHPSHVEAGKHAQEAMRHLAAGNHEGVRQHLHAMVDRLVDPHINPEKEAMRASVQEVRAARHGVRQAVRGKKPRSR